MLLKFFQHEGCFPQQRQEIPKVVQDFVAQSLGVSSDTLQDYDWLGRTAKRYRSQIRSCLGFREATAEDSVHLRKWLIEEILSQEQAEDSLILLLRERLRTLRVEPLSLPQMKRLIHFALRQYEQQFFHQIVVGLSPHCCQKLNELLEGEDELPTQPATKAAKSRTGCVA